MRFKISKFQQQVRNRIVQCEVRSKLCLEFQLRTLLYAFHLLGYFEKMERI